MGKIYDSQTALAIVARYKNSPGTIISGTIEYLTPSKVRGSFPATHDWTSKTLTHNITAALNERGYWTFWAKVTLNTGKTAIGEPSRVMIYNEGQ